MNFFVIKFSILLHCVFYEHPSSIFFPRTLRKTSVFLQENLWIILSNHFFRLSHFFIILITYLFIKIFQTNSTFQYLTYGESLFIFRDIFDSYKLLPVWTLNSLKSNSVKSAIYFLKEKFPRLCFLFPKKSKSLYVKFFHHAQSNSSSLKQVV